MRALIVTSAIALLSVQSAASVAFGASADEIAEKFARASDTAKSAPTPQPTPTAANSSERARLEAEREAETMHLAERLKAARKAKAEALEKEERDARERQAAEAAKAAAATVIAPKPAETAACPPSELAKTAPPVATLVSAPPATTAGAKSATILLAMDPGAYGIRRFNPASADPVLCIGETCYVSQGSSTPAKAMPRTLALGAGNTLGGRAGACRQKLSCIFRDVPLTAAKSELQPVDLHILRHDRREITEAAADTSCKVVAGRLTCGTLIRSATYRAVLVPETVAKTAGASALEAALPALNGPQTAAAH